MSSRRFRRIAVLVLASSLGVLSVHQAQAAAARSRTTAIIQGDLSLRTLIQNMRDILSVFLVTKDDPPPPNHPGNDPNGPAGNREGSAGCPLGPPKGGSPPNGGGPDPGPVH